MGTRIPAGSIPASSGVGSRTRAIPVSDPGLEVSVERQVTIPLSEYNDLLEQAKNVGKVQVRIKLDNPRGLAGWIPYTEEHGIFYTGQDEAIRVLMAARAEEIALDDKVMAPCRAKAYRMDDLCGSFWLRLSFLFKGRRWKEKEGMEH